MKYIRKALAAAAGAFVAGIAATAATGGLSWASAGAALGVAVGTGYATWRVENARKPAPAVR